MSVTISEFIKSFLVTLISEIWLYRIADEIPENMFGYNSHADL